MKIVRVLVYEGDREWINHTLDKSLTRIQPTGERVFLTVNGLIKEVLCQELNEGEELTIHLPLEVEVKK